MKKVKTHRGRNPTRHSHSRPRCSLSLVAVGQSSRNGGNPCRRRPRNAVRRSYLFLCTCLTSVA